MPSSKGIGSERISQALAIPNAKANPSTATIFTQHRLFEYLRFFSEAELKLLIETTVNPKDFQALAATSTETTEITIVEAYKQVGILDHTLGVLQSFQMLADSSQDSTELRQRLRSRGNKDIVGERGLTDSAAEILQLNTLLNNLKVDSRFYKIILTSLWLHDIGKLIAQPDHPELSGTIIHSSKEIRTMLNSMFTGSEIEQIESLVRCHSNLPDAVFCNIFLAYFSILRNAGTKQEQAKLLKALLLIGVADVDSYNRLTPRKIRNLNTHAANLLGLIQSERKITSPADLKNEQFNDLTWGRLMFEAFTVLEEIPSEKEELEIAYQELERLLPTEADQTRFFTTLGRLHLVGLIFNLKREFADPKLRVRLVVWTASMMDKYKASVDWIEFCYSRFNKPVKELEVQKLTELLSTKSTDEIESHLRIEINLERRALYLYIPMR